MAPPICTEVSTIGDLLVRSAAQYPDRDALVLPDERITFGNLLAGAQHVASGVIGLGIKPGTHIGLLMPNSLEFAEAFFGISLAGCVVVPINARHKATELRYIIDNADLEAVFTAAGDSEYTDFAEGLSSALPTLQSTNNGSCKSNEAPLLRHIILMRGEARPGFMDRDQLEQAGSHVSNAEQDHRRRKVCVRDTALVIYTSGTTANPKGCLLSHEACTRGPVERARYRLATSEHEVTYGPGPLFHIGSLAPFIGSLGVAGTYITDVFFDPGRAVQLMQEEGVTVAWPWFSAIVQGIIDHPEFDPGKCMKLKHLFMIAPPTLVDRVQEILPDAEILQACGMTETAGVFALSDPEESRESRNNTQGHAAPGMEVRIVSPDTGTDAAVNEMGEIWVRGYCVMDGYYADPEKTAATLNDDGWLKTGDLYTMVENGSVVFSGRLKDMLKVGGENVAAIEVEAFLCSHPNVRLAEVVGRPDERMDEVPVAFVEIAQGKSLSEDELIAFCDGQIARYKVPRAIHFVKPDDWPMSATKVNKVALRERLNSL